MPLLRCSALLTFCVVTVCGVTFAAQKSSDVRIHLVGPADARIHLVVSREGEILDLRVASNTSNELSAMLSLDAIRRAKIPLVPAELLTNGTYRDDYSFKVYA